jgi:type I restriction enzyme S subunit
MCSKIGSGKTPSGGAETYEDSGIVFLRSQNVYDEGLELSDVAYINEDVDAEMKNSRVEDFDVLLNITGASIGRSCLVPQGFPAANVNQHVCIIRLADKSISEFVAWVLKAPFIKAQIDAAQSGAAREGLNFDQISKFLLALPSKNERKEICKHLERETDKIDRLISRTDIAITRLTEFRQALITSAVTGKIDVRGLA